MALKIERYRLVGDYDDAEMEPDEEGEWVKYEDHEDMLYLAERRTTRPAKAEAHVDMWLLQAKLETTEKALEATRKGAEEWKAAWHEGDAIRTKLQARIDELTGHRRAANARATKAETELAEARAKLGSVGWVHDEMETACPGWKRAFVASVGDRWVEGKTTTAEQLAFVLTTLAEAARRRGAYSFEEG